MFVKCKWRVPLRFELNFLISRSTVLLSCYKTLGKQKIRRNNPVREPQTVGTIMVRIEFLMTCRTVLFLTYGAIFYSYSANKVLAL